MSSARLSLKNWPPGARVTTNGWLVAADPDALNACSRTVVELVPRLDTANLDWLVVGAAAASVITSAAFVWTEANGSTRMSTGENPETVPVLFSGIAGSKLNRS